MKTALIISLNFRAAHISHLVASYLQLEELGYKCYCYIHPDAIKYLPSNIKYITSLKGLKKIDLAIFWFPSLKNIKTMLRLKLLNGAKILYVYHEPIEKFKSYLNSGNSYWWTTKFFAKFYVSLIFLMLSDRIILPSKKAIRLYNDGICKLINKNYDYLPLMYPDEQTKENKLTVRQYISYIGGVSKDHAYPEFVDFIYNAYKENEFKGTRFLIASWRNIDRDERIKEMINAGVLDLKVGTPMTNDEINHFYSSSKFIWNAYNRSTQSGVLAKAFMFGTPALVNEHNVSEFIEDEREIKTVKDNKDYNSLVYSSNFILENFDTLSSNSRKNFEKNYFYKKNNKVMESIIKKLYE